MTKTFPILPDYTCPELAGYKLPQVEPRMEDDVEAMALDYTKASQAHRRGFIDGYTKACEKFIFPMETIDKIREVLCNGIATKMSLASAIVEFDKIVYNQLAPRHPIAIEAEMVEYSNGIIRPETNPDGTVKGRYIYE